MNELVNVKAEKINNEIESLNQNEIMEEVKMTTAETKLQAVEEARQNLMKAKSVLEANKDAEANIKKSALVNVGKAETAYLEALKKVELPTAKVELWNESKNTNKQVVFTKEEKEIIIATSVYSMAVSKVNLECGKDLITNEHFDKVPLYITEAALFYKDWFYDRSAVIDPAYSDFGTYPPVNLDGTRPVYPTAAEGISTCSDLLEKTRRYFSAEAAEAMLESIGAVDQDGQLCVIKSDGLGGVGLEATIEWYRRNEAWRRPAKDATEALCRAGTVGERGLNRRG